MPANGFDDFGLNYAKLMVMLVYNGDFNEAVTVCEAFIESTNFDTTNYVGKSYLLLAHAFLGNLDAIMRLLDSDLYILKPLCPWEMGIVGRYLLRNGQEQLAMRVLDLMFSSKIDWALFYDCLAYCTRKNASEGAQLFKRLVESRLNGRDLTMLRFVFNASLEGAKDIRSVLDIVHSFPSDFKLVPYQMKCVWYVFIKSRECKLTVRDYETLAPMAFSYLNPGATHSQKQLDRVVGNLLHLVWHMNRDGLQPTRKLYEIGLKLIQDSKNMTGLERWKKELPQFVR
jgi:hypothetical protein